MDVEWVSSRSCMESFLSRTRLPSCEMVLAFFWSTKSTREKKHAPCSLRSIIFATGPHRAAAGKAAWSGHFGGCAGSAAAGAGAADFLHDRHGLSTALRNNAVRLPEPLGGAIARLLGGGTFGHEHPRPHRRDAHGAERDAARGGFTPLEEARRAGEVQHWAADYRMRTKDGSHIWVSDMSYPWQDESGAIIGSVGCLRDITQRVEAERMYQEEMLRMANLDFLTGTYNRRFFFERLEEELRRLKRSRADFALAIVDVDLFRTINDRHGHTTGDAVLQRVAKRIRTCLRDTDILARVGGEEFGLLLPETGMEGAFWVAERIREAIAAEPFHVDGASNLRVTVSIGLAEADFDEPNTSAALYRMADTRLYIAKHTGRNQVSIDELLNLH